MKWRKRTPANGTVSLRKTALGMILVSSKGRTLYLFEKDRGGASSCTGACATYWPPVTSIAKPTAGSGVKAALLGWTKRGDGRMQVTYARHPLYAFALDKTAGQVKGRREPRVRREVVRRLGCRRGRHALLGDGHDHDDHDSDVHVSHVSLIARGRGPAYGRALSRVAGRES